MKILHTIIFSAALIAAGSLFLTACGAPAAGGSGQRQSRGSPTHRVTCADGRTYDVERKWDGWYLNGETLDTRATQGEWLLKKRLCEDK
jgi:hypothetical protein